MFELHPKTLGQDVHIALAAVRTVRIGKGEKFFLSVLFQVRCTERDNNSLTTSMLRFQSVLFYTLYVNMATKSLRTLS